jgi:hypothetical protein
MVQLPTRKRVWNSALVSDDAVRRFIEGAYEELREREGLGPDAGLHPTVLTSAKPMSDPEVQGDEPISVWYLRCVTCDVLVMIGVDAPPAHVTVYGDAADNMPVPAEDPRARHVASNPAASHAFEVIRRSRVPARTSLAASDTARPCPARPGTPIARGSPTPSR